MIYGIGTDIVEKKRISQAAERSSHFVERIYTPRERELISHRRNPQGLLSMNFAGKEAVAKAFGTGFCDGINPNDIEILRDEKGAPYVELYGKAREFAAAHGIRRIHISLSDTREEYAVAYVVAVAQEKGE